MEEPAIEGSSPSSEEGSFETAAPAAVLPTRAPDQPKEPARVDGPAPTAAEAAERVPQATRALLAELFKAEITGVKRISRDQLR